MCMNVSGIVLGKSNISSHSSCQQQSECPRRPFRRCWLARRAERGSYIAAAKLPNHNLVVTRPPYDVIMQIKLCSITGQVSNSSRAGAPWGPKHIWGRRSVSPQTEATSARDRSVGLRRRPSIVIIFFVVYSRNIHRAHPQ